LRALYLCATGIPLVAARQDDAGGIENATALTLLRKDLCVGISAQTPLR